MRGLNEWLEQDVHDRQSEISRVVARVDQLGQQLRGLEARGSCPALNSESYKLK